MKQLNGAALVGIAAILLSILSCSQRHPSASLQTGDLIFVGIPADYSLDTTSMDDAITSATGDDEGLNMIHVAIAEVEGDSTWIIDATIKRGVDRHPLDTFLTDFTLKDGSLPTLIVKRLKDNRKAEKYVENAKGYIGASYDIAFDPDNDKYYCSELVRDSYRDNDKDYIFDSAPMNFKNSEGEFPVYWVQLFEMLGSPIPQDVPGTNPQDMSKSDVLVEVDCPLK